MPPAIADMDTESDKDLLAQRRIGELRNKLKLGYREEAENWLRERFSDAQDTTPDYEQELQSIKKQLAQVEGEMTGFTPTSAHDDWWLQARRNEVAELQARQQALDALRQQSQSSTTPAPTPPTNSSSQRVKNNFEESGFGQAYETLSNTLANIENQWQAAVQLYSKNISQVENYNNTSLAGIPKAMAAVTELPPSVPENNPGIEVVIGLLHKCQDRVQYLNFLEQDVLNQIKTGEDNLRVNDELATLVTSSINGLPLFKDRFLAVNASYYGELEVGGTVRLAIAKQINNDLKNFEARLHSFREWQREQATGAINKLSEVTTHLKELLANIPDTKALFQQRIIDLNNYLDMLRSTGDRTNPNAGTPDYLRSFNSAFGERRQQAPLEELDVVFKSSTGSEAEERANTAASKIHPPSTIKFTLIFIIGFMADLIEYLADITGLGVAVAEIISIIMNIFWVIAGIFTLARIIRMRVAYVQLELAIKKTYSEILRYAAIYEIYSGQKIKISTTQNVTDKTVSWVRDYVIAWILGMIANLIPLLPANAYEAGMLYNREWRAYNGVRKIKERYNTMRKERERIKQAAMQVVLNFNQQEQLDV